MVLPKDARLRRRAEFLLVQEQGERIWSGDVLVIARPNKLGGARLGITASSKVGGAVTRNRIKRWAREAFRVIAPTLGAYDIVVIARKGAATMGLEGMRRTLAIVVDRLGGVRTPVSGARIGPAPPVGK